MTIIEPQKCEPVSSVREALRGAPTKVGQCRHFDMLEGEDHKTVAIAFALFKSWL